MDFKVIILGEAGVGKTSILTRLDQGTFIYGDGSHGTKSLQKEFIDHSIMTRSGNATLRIWDTGDMERYNPSLPSSLYRKKQGIVLVYSLTSKDSLRSVNNWLETAQSYYSPEAQPLYILLGNKTDDLIHKECSINDGKVMYKNKIMCFGTSALAGEGINEAFQYLAEEMLDSEGGRSPVCDRDGMTGSYGLDVNTSSAIDTPFKFVRIMKNCSLL